MSSGKARSAAAIRRYRRAVQARGGDTSPFEVWCSFQSTRVFHYPAALLAEARVLEADLIVVDVVRHFMGASADRSEWGFAWEKLDRTVPYLPELLAKDGYVTSGVASWVYVSQVYGFERGFHVYEVLDDLEITARAAAGHR